MVDETVFEVNGEGVTEFDGDLDEIREMDGIDVGDKGPITVHFITAMAAA